MKRFAVLLAVASLAAIPVLASSHGVTMTSEKPAAGAQALADGEVKKVDKDAGKVTIKHGPLASVDMPAMTMVFRVKNPAMLDTLKTGDKIRFKAEKLGGNYTVTEVQPAK
ncbi:MAG: copper-binding protein [Usitatibacter sp.]